jgi:hypothetical protein
VVVEPGNHGSSVILTFIILLDDFGIIEKAEVIDNVDTSNIELNISIIFISILGFEFTD